MMKAEGETEGLSVWQVDRRSGSLRRTVLHQSRTLSTGGLCVRAGGLEERPASRTWKTNEINDGWGGFVFSGERGGLGMLTE